MNQSVKEQVEKNAELARYIVLIARNTKT